MVTLELVTMRGWAERGFTALSLHPARKGEAQLQPSDPSHNCPSHLVQSTREEGANAWAVLGSGLGYLQAPQGWSEPLPQGQAVADHYNDNLLPDRYYCNSHALSAPYLVSAGARQHLVAWASEKAVTCPYRSAAPHSERESTAAPVLT